MLPEALAAQPTDGKSGCHGREYFTMLTRVDEKPHFGQARSRFSVLRSLDDSEYASADRLGHFYGIDLLRGLAAITILIWHYQHFYMTADIGFRDGSSDIDRTIQPFYWLLFPLYEHGFWAVNAFWVISGFVFAHVYAGRETTAAAFAGARFARLYPLHLITLITIGIIQSVSLSLTGRYQIVGANDAASFAQNLLFISGWGLPHGGNFNGPIWSVSVELAIYAIYFLIARRVFSFGLMIPIFVVTVCWCLIHADGPVWNFPLCGFFFFGGAGLYYWILRFRLNRSMIALPAALCAAYFAYLVGSGQSQKMRFYDVQPFLFVPIMLLIGSLDFSERFRNLIRPAKWIGDATYSTYLWHFPAQVLILTGFAYFGLNHHRVFSSGATLIAWVAGMALVAHFSFRRIEKPLQRFVKVQLRQASLEKSRPS